MKQSTNPLMIRTARPDDAAALEDVLTRTYQGTWQPQMTPEKYRYFLDSGKIPRYVAERGARFHVCEVEGRVAGMVDWEQNFIWALHVHPDLQRRGVGAALLAVAEAGMRADGHAEARLETDTFNTQSRAFYGKHGYAEVDTYPDEEWDSGFTTVLLVKPLA
ncbi:GNAT family N-acetyltransferase [Achromobacter ruhlandii]|uniref:GNAT family N-acetyltransferase n=1 Tax=Achromobacter ruhlandii TaxID=72557 RepID=A0A848NJM6_9BURK|nr:GNAT family N-acetyltransferase [Achromobacter ruhlandii]NMU92968.1 GNAT family N-acetyltransferase [Achromobacter ruhlandii]PJM90634.1 N-acetyltransferase [Achromobacter ruhlandii]